MGMAVLLFSSLSFSQTEETTRRHSSGPRRQLATIVFAGLGGAILGLSTLSFYGRPQDQLSNIAIGFAVGITYVTIKSATSRDYYEDKNPQSSLSEPLKLETKSEIETENTEPAVVYGPLLAKDQHGSISYGGLLGFRF